MARELAPAGQRSGPKNGPAAQSSGSKLPRHRCSAQVHLLISIEGGQGELSLDKNGSPLGHPRCYTSRHR
ncbi:hypothetical protein EAH78_24695 [Pseudomonas arsenicoxydans]|uniref:Uncharacterized protein n=1 Tax=Pseudomonas arsenicoxydans TaxID=702115 RepID=A0A502HLZ0_9PSED|nr:hypothetical protein EAH78_24695 [Pseudomonas arsenicoxydans]